MPTFVDVIGLNSLGSQPICFNKLRRVAPIVCYTKIKAFFEPALEYNVNKYQGLEMSTKLYTYFQSIVGKSIMVTWDAFYEYIFPSVQGCPMSMVKQAARDVCIDFCAKTLLWKQESTKNNIIAGEYLYTFAPPGGSKVVMPYRVAIIDPQTGDTSELTPYSEEDLDSLNPLWRDKETEKPYGYVMVSDDTIRLVGKPTVTMLDSLVANVALKPTRMADSCPNFIFEDWAEVIAAGALAKLHASKNKVWAIPELVGHYTNIYRDGVSRAKSKSAKSRIRESKHMLPVGMYQVKGYK